MISANDGIIERYRRLHSGPVYDTLDERGLPNQVLSLEIQPLTPDLVVAGWALPVRGSAEPRSQQEVQKQEPGHPDFFGLIERVRPGSVLVFETGGAQYVGSWGELTSTAAIAQGCRGVVIDGGTRDTRHLRGMGFPVFVRYASCIEANTRWNITGYDLPINISGATAASVTIRPGDFIFGDCDGVIVIPAEFTEEVLHKTEQVEREEDDVRTALQHGEAARDVFNRLKRF